MSELLSRVVNDLMAAGWPQTEAEDVGLAGELGEAWRRVEAALPEGWLFGMDKHPKATMYLALATGPIEEELPQFGLQGSTPTAALTALAEALEARP